MSSLKNNHYLMKFKSFKFKKFKSTNNTAIKKIKKGYKKWNNYSELTNKGRGQYGKKMDITKWKLFM